MIYDNKAPKRNPRVNEVINKFEEEDFVQLIDNHIIKNSNNVSKWTINEFVVSTIRVWFESRFNYKDDPDYVNILIGYYKEHSDVYTLESL